MKRWRTLHSIHVRLISGLLVVIGFALIVSGFVLYFQFYSHLEEQFDHALRDKARIIEAACEWENGELTPKMNEDYFDRIYDPSSPEFIWLRNVEVRKDVLKSASFENLDLDFPGSMRETDEILNVSTESGERVRFLVRKIDMDPGTPSENVYLAVGHHLLGMHENAAGIRKRMIEMGFLILLGLAVAIWIVLRINLRPLNSLSRQIATADPYGDHLFTVENAPSEIERVVQRLNLLMNRVDESIKNERRFSSLAAHELRTPLAGIRSIAEGSLEDKGMREILVIESRMERLVENLLILSKVEAGGQVLNMEKATPGRLLAKNWATFFDAAEGKDIEFWVSTGRTEHEMMLPVQFLNIVLRNLFDNAVEYTLPSGKIEATASFARDGYIEFVVDNGPIGELYDDSIPDSARNPTTELAERHLGLGLTICRRIARVLDAHFEFERMYPNIARAKIKVRYQECARAE
ncbi:MAG: hypothetical protein CMO55_04690 [Verrucomicrobiales bacterium]|nr:hypothetical protein [Verrucomicrobiales bacterium]